MALIVLSVSCMADLKTGSKAINSNHRNFKQTYCQDCEHALCHVERMSPVVVRYWTVVLLNTKDPPTKCL